MFLVLNASNRVENAVIWLGVVCSNLRLRAERRLLPHSFPRSSYPK